MRAGQTAAGDHIRTLFDCELPSDKENETFVKCLEKAQLSGSGIRFVVIGKESEGKRNGSDILIHVSETKKV